MTSSVEAELQDLHRRIKQLETSKRGSQDETQRIIAAQRSQIDQLRKENRQLQDQLALDAKVRHKLMQWTWFMELRCMHPYPNQQLWMLHLQSMTSVPSAYQQDRIDKLHDLIDTYNRKVRSAPTAWTIWSGNALLQCMLKEVFMAGLESVDRPVSSSCMVGFEEV